MTLGWPFSMTATHELVVPRSMPMILAMCYLVGFPAKVVMGEMGGSCLLFNGLGHRHQRRPDHAVAEEVAFLQHLHHGIGLLRRFDRADCLVPVRVELLADRVDLRQA